MPPDEFDNCYKCYDVDYDADALYWEARAAYLGCTLPVALYAACRTMTRVVTRPPMRAKITFIEGNDTDEAARLAKLAERLDERLG